MKPWLQPEQVREHVPKGRKLPARFDAFVRAEPPYCRVEWNDLDAYSLKPSATNTAVPFLRLPDGGLVALWYCETSPVVVHIGGHGELKVLAQSFDDFLKSVALQQSGLPDFDEIEHPFVVPGTAGQPNTEDLQSLQERFGQWFKEHTSLLSPLKTPETEELRQRVFRIAEEMIRDGRARAYTLRERSWWSMHYRIERNGTVLSITYLDYGNWYPVPDEYKLADEVAALLELVLDTTRSYYELSVQCTGIVSIDRDRQLLLVTPKQGENAT